VINFDILSKILKLNIGVSQSDNTQMFDLLETIYPLTIKKYQTGREHNGWVIPREWNVKKAYIKKDDLLLFDGKSYPLAVAGYSSSFHGIVKKEELDRHVFYRKEFPDAYAFHCMNNIRPWKKHWGFCIPYGIYKTWEEGEYEVALETEFLEGTMLVGECRHEGQLSDTIVFNAHTCHPCQANDDMVGVFVILELFRWLSEQKTRYTYLGILAPEHIGTVFYIADTPKENLDQIKMACFIEMIGSQTPLTLQRSFTGDTIIDRVTEYVLKEVEPDLKVGDFSTVVGNDEIIWEGPGIEIPTVSVSRWPYDEYHTSKDDLTIISEEKIAEVLSLLKRIVMIFENDCTIERNFTGLMALSNPKYDLYFEHPDPTVHKSLSDLDLKFAKLQDYLQRFFDNKHSLFGICERFEIPFEDLLKYISKFQKKDLVILNPIPGLEQYKRLK
jgi:aminopeptidase-like protein